ncbi:MAG: hypothetical protein JSU59_10700 [Nitrospirota bacterium]|nr:MAG: hypothetical protein JSU59_10700 [Nitrospirota bacterium]
MARLLKFIERGERLAHDCAQAQAALAPAAGMRRFLLGQARQEGLHAVAFKWAIGWLAPRHVGEAPFLKPFDQYAKLLHTALERKDFAESLLAEQIILEGLGEALLKKIEAGLSKRKAPFKKLRRMLLHQEEAHHAFGVRNLQRAIDRQEISTEQLCNQAQEYLLLAESMISSVTDLFDAIDENPKDYLAEFHRHLPSWLDPNSQSGNHQLFPFQQTEN